MAAAPGGAGPGAGRRLAVPARCGGAVAGGFVYGARAVGAGISVISRAWRRMCVFAATLAAIAAGLLHRLLPGGRRQQPAPQQLSPLEAERLSQLRCRAAVPYDADAEEHQARGQCGRAADSVHSNTSAADSVHSNTSAADSVHSNTSAADSVHSNASAADATLMLRAQPSMPPAPQLPSHSCLAVHALQAALRGLWEVAFPDSPFPPGIKHPQWKAMGWQSENPGTDFRQALPFDGSSGTSRKRQQRRSKGMWHLRVADPAAAAVHACFLSCAGAAAS